MSEGSPHCVGAAEPPPSPCFQVSQRLRAKDVDGRTKSTTVRLGVRPEMEHDAPIGYRRPRESGGPEQPFEPCGPCWGGRPPTASTVPDCGLSQPQPREAVR